MAKTVNFHALIVKKNYVILTLGPALTDVHRRLLEKIVKQVFYDLV